MNPVRFIIFIIFHIVQSLTIQIAYHTITAQFLGLHGVLKRTSNNFWNETGISGISNAGKASKVYLDGNLLMGDCLIVLNGIINLIML